MKIGITLLSLVMIGACYGEIDKQPTLTEMLKEGKRPVGALLGAMREIEIKKQEAGEVSDMLCLELLPGILAICGGVLFSVKSMIHKSNFVQVAGDGIKGFVISQFATMIVFDLCAERVKRGIERKIEQQYKPEIEKLKEEIRRELIDISSESAEA